MEDNKAINNSSEEITSPVQNNNSTSTQSNKKNYFWIFGVIVVLLLCVGGVSIYLNQSSKKPVATSTTSEKQIVLGFSLGSLQEERWQHDRDEFTKYAKSLGVSVDIEGGNNDKTLQISQAEGMIARGVNVLLITAYDATSMAGVISDAHKAGIKVISYDRLITNSNVDYYISFDNENVGELQAQSVVNAIQDKLMKGKKLKFAYIGGAPTDNNSVLLKQGSFKVLQPLIDKGEIQIVLDKPTENWNPDNAYNNLRAYLSQSNGAIDAVVCANDGTAFGAVKALQEYHLDGKVPVSGQDAELAALQRVVAGTQTSTVYKPIPKLADAAVDLAIKVANNQKIVANAKVNDGTRDVPSVLLKPILVTKNNIADTVIKDNYHTSKEIYQQ